MLIYEKKVAAPIDWATAPHKFFKRQAMNLSISFLFYILYATNTKSTPLTLIGLGSSPS